MVNRAKLRGKPLDEDCKTARTTINEYGPADNRTFCYGIFDRRTDTPIEKCYGCKAFVENATPLKGQTEKFVADLLTADDVISESAKSLVDMLAEAQAKALKEGIKANTVIIDEHFAKVNAFDFVFGRDVMHLPPMICGLEVQVSDELPDGYSFAVLEAPETERERLIRKARAEVIDEFAGELKEYLDDTYSTGEDALIDICDLIDFVAQKMKDGAE